jgi:uncharacterized membrane protein YeaQ/YmgE (transglycosylase-associated protein family)
MTSTGTRSEPFRMLAKRELGRGKRRHFLFWEKRTMRLSNESLLIIIAVGLIAGWLAGQVMRGSGFGLIGDLIVGWLGALIGDWLLPRLNIHLGAGIVALVFNALIGAIVLLLILRLIAGRGLGYPRWRRRW